MREDLFTAHWQELRPRIKANWNRLTDAELDQVAGDAGTLIALIEERYGEARRVIELELDRLLKIEAGSQVA